MYGSTAGSAAGTRTSPAATGIGDGQRVDSSVRGRRWSCYALARCGGLVLGERQLFGLLNIDITEDLVHIVTGGLLAWAGFGQRNISLARTVATVVGVGYVLVGLVGFVQKDLFGLQPHHYSNFDNVTHVLLGLLGIAAARVLPADSERAPGRHAEGRTVQPGA